MKLQHLLAAVVLLLAAGAPPAWAQSAPSSFDGTYTYVPQGGDVIGAAIERGIDDMSFVTRPIARRRLRSTNQPYGTIRLTAGDGRVSTAYDGRDPIVSPADGSPAAWSRDGEALTVHTRLSDGVLTQTFTAEDGVRENAFTLSPDRSRLTLRVTVRSPRLTEPIVYALTYERAR